MELSSFIAIPPSVFDGKNYQMRALKMEAYVDANDLWEAVEVDYEVPPLPEITELLLKSSS